MGDAAGTVVRDNPPISSIRVLRRAPARTEWTDDSTREEPVSPSSRLMGDIYIIVMVGFGVSINLPMFRAGLEAQLAQYARLTSVQVTEDGKPRWVRTTVNMDDHLMLPRLDPTAMKTQPDQVVEDYVAALTTVPMNRSRPLWECHFLDFPTSEATSTLVMRAEHSIGDGMSALSFLLASTRSGSAHMTTSLPSRRLGATYALPWSRPQHSVGAASFVASVWSSFVLAWHTLVETALFLATVLFLRDPHTLLKGQAKDSSSKFHGKRFAQRTLSLDDIKFIKDALNCTVNDVLLGLTSAALSRYYFRQSGDRSTRKICLRSILVVNIRPDTSLQGYSHVNMTECDMHNDVAWGNKLGYIILPFRIAMHDDQLAYIRDAKKVADRRKSSFEAIITQKIANLCLKCFGTKGAAFIKRRVVRNTTLLFSNMIGPVELVELWGHPITFIAPSVYRSAEGLTVHYQSYCNIIKVVLSFDVDKLPYFYHLLDDFVVSLGLIKDAASSSSRHE